VPTEVPRIDAPLRGGLRASGPLASPGEWQASIELELEPMRRVARQVPWYLRGPFPHTPLVGAAASAPAPARRQLWLGEASGSFVPLGALPAHVVRAVTTAEDAGFFAHPGFDFEEMKRSLLDPEERARGRGASTISQQLAKNLYLSGERTYARKLREALTTVALEAALPKARILELYLNLIEWGPGLYGVGEAARYYFDKDARSLTPREAAFLATLIPSPVRYHVFFARRSLSEKWEEHVDALLQKLLDQGVLTPEQHAQARAEPLAFRPGDEPL
jgi:membrane peptidoglycan carboxypeptidase